MSPGLWDAPQADVRSSGVVHERLLPERPQIRCSDNAQRHAQIILDILLPHDCPHAHPLRLCQLALKTLEDLLLFLDELLDLQAVSTDCETRTVCLFSILFSMSFDEFDIAPA